MFNDRLAQLRTLLHQTPDMLAWETICEAIDAWPAGADLEVALSYVEDHQARWPDKYRVAPYKWVGRFTSPGFDERLRLVRALVLEHRRFDEVAEDLSRNLSRVPLTELELRHSPMEDEGFGLLLSVKESFESLRRLSIVDSNVSDEAVAVMSASGWASGLVRLDLEDGTITDAGVSRLCTEVPFFQLEHLSLMANDIGNGGVQTILEAPWVARLKTLNLAGNHCDDGAARMIADCPELTGLESLNMGSTMLSLGGYEILASSEFLSEEIRAIFEWALH